MFTCDIQNQHMDFQHLMIFFLNLKCFSLDSKKIIKMKLVSPFPVLITPLFITF